MSRNQTNLLLDDANVSRRVEIAPHLDRWMAGDRFGEVVKTGLRYYRVKMDRSGDTIRVAPENIHRWLS